MPVTRMIHLPAVRLSVPLSAYLAAVRMAKANPAETFKHGFTTWWPTTGAEILEQFNRGVQARINQAIPYSQRGMKGTP